MRGAAHHIIGIGDSDIALVGPSGAQRCEMNRANPSMPRGDPMGDLAKSFIEGVSWPVDRTSLVALSDLGLNPKQIARYFSVTVADVSALLKSITPAEVATTGGGGEPFDDKKSSRSCASVASAD